MSKDKLGKTKLCVDAGTAKTGLREFEENDLSKNLQNKTINDCLIVKYEECDNVVRSESGTKDCIVFLGITSCLAMIIDAGDSGYVFGHVVEYSDGVSGQDDNIKSVLKKISDKYELVPTNFNKIWLFDYEGAWESSVNASIACGADKTFIDLKQENVDIVVAMGDSIKYVIHDRKNNTLGSEIQL